GTQRWIWLGPLQIQPSEMMKLPPILALARYFHGFSYEEIGKLRYLFIPTLMVLLPAGLVLMQPDLGTAGMLILGGALLFFAAGVRVWKFAVVLAGGPAGIPVAWEFLRDYQKNRILPFLNSQHPPRRARFHILPSKIP